MAGIQGTVVKGVGGFYYVKTADTVLECRARGIFRKQKITPLAGDRVTVEGEEGGYVLSEIAPRTNAFQRPPVANVDRLFLVVSACDPRPNLRVVDELSAIACKNGVVPVIVLTKTDLVQADEFLKIYRHAGFETIDLRADEKNGFNRIRELGQGKLSVFIGNSGVGKSTLLNMLCPALKLETGETSKKLGRGRHTTRAVELYPFEGGWIADTPGFSAIDLEHTVAIKKEELADCFPEFDPYKQKCYFAGCSHTVEKGCAVLKALDEQLIEPSRHESYVQMYRQAKERENDRR